MSEQRDSIQGQTNKTRLYECTSQSGVVVRDDFFDLVSVLNRFSRFASSIRQGSPRLATPSKTHTTRRILRPRLRGSPTPSLPSSSSPTALSRAAMEASITPPPFCPPSYPTPLPVTLGSCSPMWRTPLLQTSPPTISQTFSKPLIGSRLIIRLRSRRNTSSSRR